MQIDFHQDTYVRYFEFVGSVQNRLSIEPEVNSLGLTIDSKVLSILVSGVTTGGDWGGVG